jgi:microcystin-dependent protein
MAKRTRAELKGIFKNNAQPNELDFHDFIDSVLNAIDDSIERPADSSEPVRVIAKGEQQRLLDFYREDGFSSWRLSQSPVDTDEGGNRDGFTISTANGENHLFINEENGAIGISNLDPGAQLHITAPDIASDALRVDAKTIDSTPSTALVVTGDGRLAIGLDNPGDGIQARIAGTFRVDLNSGKEFVVHKTVSESTTEAVLTVNNDGGVQINGDLTVTGDVIATDEQHIEGDVTLGNSDTDEVTVAGLLKSSHSSDQLQIGDELAVSDKATFSGQVQINNTLKFQNGQAVDEFSSATMGSRQTVVPTEQSVADHVDNAIRSALPAGSIVMWSGAVDQVPTGWRLCNGSNDTPNLRDRFVVGAGGQYGAHATGGNQSITLSTSHLPSHNHTYYDTVFAENRGGANYSGLYKIRSDRKGIGQNGGTDFDNDWYARQTSTWHSGSGNSFDIRPPYYALAYIMKVYS